MGTDIHIRCEKKRVRYGQEESEVSWEEANLYNSSGRIVEPWAGRNYTLFSLLAGVRARCPQLKPNFTPNDLTSASKELVEVYDFYHNATCYTLDELYSYLDILKDRDESNFHVLEILDDFIRSLQIWANAQWVNGAKHFRVIVAFDS